MWLFILLRRWSFVSGLHLSMINVKSKGWITTWIIDQLKVDKVKLFYREMERRRRENLKVREGGHFCQLFAPASRFIHLLLAFDSVFFAGDVFSPRFRRDQLVEGCVAGPSVQNFFRAPTAGKFFPACGNELFVPASQFIHLLLAFDSLCFIFSTLYRRDKLVKRSVTGP